MQQLVAAFAATFLGGFALAMLLGHVWFGLPMPRTDLWALGMVIVTTILSLLVSVGAFLGSRRDTRATVPAARWAGIFIAVPIVVAFETVEFWSTFVGPAPAPLLVFTAVVVWCVGAPLYFMRANSALLSGAYPAALRASSGAAKRER